MASFNEIGIAFWQREQSLGIHGRPPTPISRKGNSQERTDKLRRGCWV
jgi:hypothetical protein